MSVAITGNDYSNASVNTSSANVSTRRPALEKLSEFIYFVEPKHKENVCDVFYEADKLPIDPYDRDQFIIRKLGHFLSDTFSVGEDKRQSLSELSSLLVPSERKKTIDLRQDALNDLSEMFEEMIGLIERRQLTEKEFDSSFFNMIEQRLRSNLPEEYAHHLQTVCDELQSVPLPHSIRSR